MNRCSGLQSCAPSNKRYSVTHYELDERLCIRHDSGVKIFPTACTLLLPGALALFSACKPQGPNIAELNELQRRNAELRQEIADMRARIRRAGDDVPGLAEQLEARDKEVTQAYENLKALKKQETDIRMRRIELEGRLDAFRSTFRELQSQIAAASSKTEP